MHDEEIGPAVAGQPALVGAVGPAAVEMGQYAAGAGEEDVEAASTGFVAEGLGEVGLGEEKVRVDLVACGTVDRSWHAESRRR
jgi:hypothetical protein